LFQWRACLQFLQVATLMMHKMDHITISTGPVGGSSSFHNWIIRVRKVDFLALHQPVGMANVRSGALPREGRSGAGL
jgi:hypothetical protein